MNETTLDLRTVLPNPEDIRAITKQYEALAEAEEKVKRSGRGMGSNVAPAPPRVSGPYSNFSRANSRYNEAIETLRRSPSSIGSDALSDLKYGRDTAAKRLKKVEDAGKKPEIGKAFKDFIVTSRFGGGGGFGGIMPLVNKGGALAEAAFGTEIAALAGPVGIAATAFVEVGKAVYRFTEDAAKAGQELSRLRFSTGASSAEAARLQSYSRAFGVDFGGMASGLNERITTDPMARSYAARFGAGNIAGHYGNQDHAGNLLKVVEGLRTITNEQERLRVARTLGVEGALPLTQVSNGTFRTLKSDAGISARVMDPQFQKDSAEFGAAAGRVQGGFEAMSTAMSKNFFPIIIPALNGIADAEYALAAFANGDIKSAFQYSGKSLTNFGLSSANASVGAVGLSVPGSKPLSFKGFGGDGGGGDSGTGGDGAIGANTSGLQAVTIALASLTNQLGLSERAQSRRTDGQRDPTFFSRPDEMAMIRFGAL